MKQNWDFERFSWQFWTRCFSVACQIFNKFLLQLICHVFKKNEKEKLTSQNIYLQWWKFFILECQNKEKENLLKRKKFETISNLRWDSFVNIQFYLYFFFFCKFTKASVLYLQCFGSFFNTYFIFHFISWKARGRISWYTLPRKRFCLCFFFYF